MTVTGGDVVDKGPSLKPSEYYWVTYYYSIRNKALYGWIASSRLLL